MTKSEIWELVIKIFGLYCLLALFMAIPMVGTALAMNKPDFFANWNSLCAALVYFDRLDIIHFSVPLSEENELFRQFACSAC